MDSRRRKQLIYGLFYLAIICGIGALSYRAFVYTAPSCFDRTQNQGEQGVDCGGPCAVACIPTDLSSISIQGDVMAFNAAPASSVLPMHYTFLAQVANANAQYAAPSVYYQFQLLDASGTVLQSVPGWTFVYGAEVKYLIAPNVTVNQGFSRVSLSVTDPKWVEARTVGLAPRFNNPSVTGTSVGSSTVSVSGTLTDNDLSAFSNVQIVAVFYGSFGGPIGASATSIDHISPGETATFSVLYPAMPGLDPSRTQLFAYALRP